MVEVQETEGAQKVVRLVGRLKTLASHQGEAVTMLHPKSRRAFNSLLFSVECC